jgi:hypothetical protein
VAALLRVHQRMDWGRVLEQAEASGSMRILVLGLLLANDLRGAALPEGIAQRLQTDAAVTRLGTQVCAQLFREADGSATAFETLLFRLRGRERLRDKLRYCIHRPTTLTVGDWALRRLLPFVPRSVQWFGACGKRLAKRRR